MSANRDEIIDTIQVPSSYEELKAENEHLLAELELAYTNMERVVQEANFEKEIAYKELQKKFDSLESLYSELSKKENMLVHLEKLSSIGQFITELIHEVSSPMTVISLQSQMALLKNIPDSEKQDFRVILENSNRVKNLLERFKAMAYKGKEDFKTFDLNRSLSVCLETVELIKPKNKQIETSFCEGELPVYGDQHQIDQIVLNLSKNAFDAMKRRGTILRVETRKISRETIQEGKSIGYCPVQTDYDWPAQLENNSDFALAEFIDEGSGIEPDLMQNLFQPFYTTKERGKGTGLGLSISRDIATRHNGNLAVKSIAGKGTTFQLLIPIHSN